MDQDNDIPSEINSFHMSKAFNPKILNVSKKRKLLAEQLGLPMPKHKCWDDRLPPEPLSTLEENEEVEDSNKQITKENEEKHIIDEGSDPESAKDSNSFVGDSDSIMSLCSESKEPEVSKRWPCDRPSTSSYNWGSRLKDAQCFLDNAVAITSGAREELACMVGEHEPCHQYDGLEVSHNLEEVNLEFESHLDYSCAEYGDDVMEPSTDKELDMLFSNSLNPNVYVLSSGRWKVNQDIEGGTRKPTIDQEFEQYFSTLML